jgi:hypothetical protein
MPIKQIFRAGLILGLCITCSPLIAQDYRPGYIIKSNADSIRGLVRYMGSKNDVRCDFKSSKRSKRTSFNASELIAYGFDDGRNYISMTLPGADAPKGKVFARVVVKGPLTLYRYDKTFYVEKDSLIRLPIPKGKIVDPVVEGGNKMEKKDKRYVAILNQLMADCQMKADDASYSEGDLMNLVKNYNRCKGFAREYESAKPKPFYRMNVGALGGYVSSSLDLKESAYLPFDPLYTTIDPAKTVIGGISLDISSPRIYDKLFLTIESWYFNATYLGRDYRTTSLQDITIDVNSIRMFVGFRYNFLHENNTPFFKTGFSGTITQDLDVKSITEGENALGQVFYWDDVTGTMFVKKVKGFWLSAGYEYLIKGKMKAFAEFRFERADAYFGTPINTDSKLNNYSLLVGIRF